MVPDSVRFIYESILKYKWPIEQHASGMIYIFGPYVIYHLKKTNNEIRFIGIEPYSGNHKK